jgi:hypothetical protein
VTKNHPITPPPELRQEWIDHAPRYLDGVTACVRENWLITRAAHWGADQELEACLTWFQEFYKTESWVRHDLERFRSARRPKFYSLKQQVLRLLQCPKELWSETEVEAIRLLIEQIDD